MMNCTECQIDITVINGNCKIQSSQSKLLKCYWISMLNFKYDNALAGKLTTSATEVPNILFQILIHGLSLKLGYDLQQVGFWINI